MSVWLQGVEVLGSDKQRKLALGNILGTRRREMSLCTLDARNGPSVRCM